MSNIIITGKDLTLEQIAAICRGHAKIELAEEAKQNIIESRKVVDDLVAEEKVVYGITTGFGKFSDVVISQDQCKALQKNLIITHAVGAGDPFSEDIARGIMLLIINNLVKGFSGIRLETVQTKVDMLNKGVTAFIPEKGSLGASGDLAPLSHMVLPMLGLGMAYYEGELLPGAEAMKRAGIPTIELSAKEGLALNNGTQAMTSAGSLALYDALNLLKVADIADALCFEAQNGVVDALDHRVHDVRPHSGQLATARNLLKLELLPGAEAMKRAGIPTIELSAKEGLALNNGTQAMTSAGSLALYDALNLLKVADIADALCFEAQNGVVDALDHRVHDVRPHSGQLATARNLLKLLEGRKNTTRQGEIRVQDAYSLRCSPQIHGASKDAINYVLDKVNIEINSVTDNPIIFKEDRAGISGGNFHGQPMALSFDFLGIGVAELANVSERRIERLVNPAYSDLPAFLTPHGGVCSGIEFTESS